MAFLQSYFELLGVDEVQLFRGMTTEGEIFEKTKTLVSTSFNPDVAQAFATIDYNEQITFSYVYKFRYPVKNLFMTYFETEILNTEYKEQEAVIFYREKMAF